MNKKKTSQRETMAEVHRVVVKIGSSLLEENRNETVQSLAGQIQSIVAGGREVVLVTSGAIYFGVNQLNRSSPPITLPQKQATAAVGQPLLMSFYQEIFRQFQLETAQVLLTQDGIHNHQTYLNACNTMNCLLDMDVIPIVNENDTVATEEIQFGNNDMLASLATTMIDGDLLIILSDVDGLYAAGPAPDRQPIREIKTIDDDIRSMARPSDDGRTTVGGMSTKIEAAETLTESGIPMAIANGNQPDVLTNLLSGDPAGTLFHANLDSPLRGRKRWIGHHLPVKGQVKVDQGATKALTEGNKSLLPSGVTETTGRYERGDTIEIIDSSGKSIGRGLSNYSAQDVQQLRGCQSEEISDILGYHNFDEIIHRDNLVIVDDE